MVFRSLLGAWPFALLGCLGEWLLALQVVRPTLAVNAACVPLNLALVRSTPLLMVDCVLTPRLPPLL